MILGKGWKEEFLAVCSIYLMWRYSERRLHYEIPNTFKALWTQLVAQTYHYTVKICISCFIHSYCPFYTSFFKLFCLLLRWISRKVKPEALNSVVCSSASEQKRKGKRRNGAGFFFPPSLSPVLSFSSLTVSRLNLLFSFSLNK